MPFVKLLTADNRVGVRDVGGSRPSENTQEALDMIRQLDGRAYTQVVLEGDGKALLIGGGNDGRYNVVLAVNIDEAFYNLLNPAACADTELANTELKVVTGGQAGLFPTRQCVDLETTLKAAAVFFDTGKMAQDLVWERQ